MNLYISMTELAEALGVSRQTIYYWTKTSKELKVEKKNKSTRCGLTRDDVIVLLEERRDKLNDQVNKINTLLDTLK